MTPDDSFLVAILAAPDDDAPRLVYADHLEERGDPRGEFIRVQCELARLPEGDRRRKDLERKERVLLAEHGEEWAGPVQDLVVQSEFRRGFIDGVTLPAGDF